MKSRLTTVLVVMVLVAFGSGGAFAGASELGVVGGTTASKAQGKQAKKKAKKKSRTCSALTAKKAKKGKKAARACARKRAKPKSAAPSAAVQQYGTRPGKGCGDRNHVHTGPPGNPTNTQCPPQAGPKS